MFRARLHARCNRLSTIVLVHMCMRPGSTVSWHVRCSLARNEDVQLQKTKNAHVEE